MSILFWRHKTRPIVITHGNFMKLPADRKVEFDRQATSSDYDISTHTVDENSNFRPKQQADGSQEVPGQAPKQDQPDQGTLPNILGRLTENEFLINSLKAAMENAWQTRMTEIEKRLAALEIANDKVSYVLQEFMDAAAKDISKINQGAGRSDHDLTQA